MRRQELERHLQSCPADLTARVELAWIYREEDRPANAVRVLAKALDFEAEDPHLLWIYEEALLARSLQQLREVTTLAARLKTIEAEQAQERCEANWAFCRIDVCQARLQRDPSNQHLRLTLAQTLKELQRFDEAIQQAETAAEDPRYAPMAHLVRAQCLDATGRRIEALPAYRAAALRRSNPAPPRIRVIAMRAAVEIAEALGLDASSQRYRRFLQLAKAELSSGQARDLPESQDPPHPRLLERDIADEKLIAEYESTTLKTREKLHRLIAGLRQARRQERAAVARKVADRCNAVQNLYNRRKKQPATQQQKDCGRLDKAMATVEQAIEEVRSIVVRRLDHLPDVAPVGEADWPPKPTSVREAEAAIHRTSQQIRETGRELLVSTPAKLVDTFWILPSICGVFLVLWTVGVLIVSGPQPWLAMTSGVPIAFVLFLSMLGALQVPLRRQTRDIYPRAEHLYAAARRALEAGKAIAAATAAEDAADLIKQRDSHLRAAERWKQENFAAIDQTTDATQTAKRQMLEQELETVRQRFKAEIAQRDASMLEPRHAADAPTETTK